MNQESGKMKIETTRRYLLSQVIMDFIKKTNKQTTPKTLKPKTKK
jgi:hypothetical protein